MYMFTVCMFLCSMFSPGSTSIKDVECRRPEQVRLSLGDDYSKMFVMWATAENTTSWVTYRLTDSVEYNRKRSRVSELTEESYAALRFIHRAELVNLKEGTVYYYYVTASCTDGNISSDEFNFTTLTTNQKEPVSVLVFGDMGTGNHLRARIQKLKTEINSLKYQSIFHVGDFAYDLHTDGGKLGDQFLREIENISAFVPYMTSPGNHEIFTNFHHYTTRFSTPNTKWPIPIDNMFYSYDIGPVHFISYSSEVYFTHDQNYVCKQFDWLLNDLIHANKNRHIHPWVVAMGHRPMYCSNSDEDDCIDGMFIKGWTRRGLEDLLYSQGVDLILQGHEHSYERSFPMYKGSPISLNYIDPRAPVHIISGAAGSKEGFDSEMHEESWSAVIDRTSPRENSYGRLHIHNSSHLHWEQITFISDKILDSLWIVQRSHGPFDRLVDCSENGKGTHPSCFCPMVFHFETCIIIVSVLIIAIVICVVIVCGLFWRRRTIAKRRGKVEYLLVNDRFGDE